MAEFILVADLPTAIQSNELVDAMVAGANAKASRVAPCLVEPTSTAWAATTAYAVGDRVKIATNQYLEVTIAGTSGGIIPTAPSEVGGTVADGTVTWQRIGPTPDALSEAKLILLGAVKRWADAGSGALQSQTAGPFGQTLDTRQRTGFNLWPSEINDLQAICKGLDATPTRQAFSIDTGGSFGTVHSESCALAFGALYCDCGADIAGFPLFEGA